MLQTSVLSICLSKKDFFHGIPTELVFGSSYQNFCSGAWYRNLTRMALSTKVLYVSYTAPRPADAVQGWQSGTTVILETPTPSMSLIQPYL